MKEPKKRKRLFAKIITVVCCLSIVLTLTVLPCFATSGLTFYGSNVEHIGIPFNLTFQGTSSYINPDDLTIGDALCVPHTGFNGVIPSGVAVELCSLNTMAFLEDYSIYVGMEYASEQVSGIRPHFDVDEYDFPFVESFDSYYILTTFGINSAMCHNSSQGTIDSYFNSVPSYDPLLGKGTVRLYSGDVLGLNEILNVNLPAYLYIYNFAPVGSIDLFVNVTYDVYYYDTTDGGILTEPRTLSLSPVVSNIDLSYVNVSQPVNKLVNSYYNVMDIDVNAVQVPYKMIFEEIYNNLNIVDAPYITNLHITFGIDDDYSGYNPYLADMQSKYSHYSILGVGCHGIDMSSDVVAESRDGFNGYLNAGIIREYVSLEDFSLTDWLGDTLGGVMSTRIIGPITIGSVLYVAVGVGFVMLVLKFFAGG